VDSKLCDAQTGYESLLTALLPSLAGANLVYGSGMLDSGMVLDYGKMILDDEINQSIKRIVKGVQVTETSLAVDLIKEVGHTGNYLTHPSTLNHFAELIQPRLMNRESHESWSASGRTSVYERALEKARELEATHQSKPISEQAQQEIDEIIRETEKELKAKNRGS
jgi:trimethylamine--corrinoid protein Co-methyltransferase